MLIKTRKETFRFSWCAQYWEFHRWPVFTDATARRCSIKISQIHRKTLVSESLFNNVSSLLFADLVKRDSSNGVFLYILINFPQRLLWKNNPATPYLSLRILVDLSSFILDKFLLLKACLSALVFQKYFKGYQS